VAIETRVARGFRAEDKKMEKLVYVVWKPAAESPTQFKDRMLGPVADALQGLGVAKLSMNIADEHVEYAASMRLTQFDPPPAATVSFWLDCADDRGPYEDALATAADRIAGYLVVESVPLHNTTHTARIGERVPGTNMVALIERPDHIEYDAWIYHWHGHHKRVALETQCTYLYIRNVVVRALTPDAPAWAGIVEEGFPTEAVTDPMLWYSANGSKETLEKNFGAMMESVSAFLDVARVESHPMSEYRIKE
jgi:hypothetical protein